MATEGAGSDVKTLDVDVKKSQRIKMLTELRDRYEKKLGEFPHSELMYFVDDFEQVS